MGRHINHHVRQTSLNALAEMNEAAAANNIPIPLTYNTIWGQKRVHCPGCTIDLQPQKFIEHYQSRHAIIEGE